MFTTNIKRSAAALAATAGLLAAAAPASHADSWPTHPSGLKADSNEVAVEGITLSHEGAIWRTVVADAGAGDDKITQAREPAPVTMLDYMGSPVVTY